MSEQLNTLICTSIEVLFFIILYHSYTGINFKIKNPRLIFLLGKIVCSVLLSFISNDLLYSVLSVSTAFVLYHFYFNDTLINSLFYYSFLYIFTMLIEIPVAIITMPLAKRLDSNIYSIIGSATTLLLVFLICRIFKINRLYKIFDSERKPLRLIIINIFILCFCIF